MKLSGSITPADGPVIGRQCQSKLFHRYFKDKVITSGCLNSDLLGMVRCMVGGGWVFPCTIARPVSGMTYDSQRVRFAWKFRTPGWRNSTAGDSTTCAMASRPKPTKLFMEYCRHAVLSPADIDARVA